MHLYITSTQKQWFAGSLFIVLCIFLFGKFPGMLYGSLTGFSGPFAFLLPAFCVLTLFSLLLDLKITNSTVKLILKLLTTTGCILGIFYAVEILSGGNLKLLLIENLGAFIFTFFLLAALIAMLYAVTGNLPWSIRGIMLLMLVYGVVSHFVFEFRGTVFIPQDIFSARTAAAVVGGYTFTFTQPLAEGLLACVCIFFVAAKTALPKMDRIKTRIIRVISVLSAVLFLYSTINEGMFTNFEWSPQYWNQSLTAVQNGSLINFTANIPDMMYSSPDGYSVREVGQIASQYPSDSAADADVKPDVILILGESWAAMDTDGLMQTNKPVAPYISSLANQSNSIYGDLVVSQYGGGTSRSEFQVLTGTSSEYGIHSAPFQFNMHDSIPSLVSSFNALGYESTALHTGTASAWGRDKAFPMLGFAQFYSQEEIKDVDNSLVRNYLSDQALYSHVLSILDEADTPQFIHAVTIQAHGGYDATDYQSDIEILSPAGEYPEAEQYLGLMNESDQHFQYLIEQLMQRERPTIVLAYGDHLPTVDEEYLQYVEEEFGDTEEGVRTYEWWKHQTFYVMWANYDLPEEALNYPSCVSLNYLAPQLMQSAGLPLTGYQKFLLEGVSQYPVTDLRGFVSAEGNYLSTHDAQTLELYKRQAIMQYNLMYDSQNYPDNFYFLA